MNFCVQINRTWYCDFMKAFDTVSHGRLAQVLEYYSFDAYIVDWSMAFLSQRRQRVVVNGSESTRYDVMSVIPQGSVLGPVLFAIYINTMVDRKADSEVFYMPTTQRYSMRSQIWTIWKHCKLIWIICETGLRNLYYVSTRTNVCAWELGSRRPIWMWKPLYIQWKVNSWKGQRGKNIGVVIDTN